MDASFGSWGTQTLIAGLGAGALIAQWLTEGAMDGDAFAGHISKVSVPVRKPGTIAILVARATHKTAAAAKAV